MSREEEIKQAAKNRADQYEHPVDWNNCYHHYIQGAEWADQHPKKGLWNAEKVIRWLMNNINNYLVKGRDIDLIYEDLHKAMEE
jgi:hypothetical protein